MDQNRRAFLKAAPVTALAAAAVGVAYAPPRPLTETTSLADESRAYVPARTSAARGLIRADIRIDHHGRPGDPRTTQVWDVRTGEELSGRIPIQMAGRFARARVGSQIRFRAWARDDKGCVFLMGDQIAYDIIVGTVCRIDP